MYIAKLHTRYPEYHGTGYYNFVIGTTEEELNEEIERMSHDYRHVATIKTRHKSRWGLYRAYPTKQSLNERFNKEA